MSLFDNLTDLSKLKGMLNLSGLKGGSSVLGIDIGSSAIKVVQLRKDKGQAVLETYGELSLGPYGDLEIGRATNLDADKLAQALHDILQESNITTKNCGVSIPFAASLISLIELPAVDNSKLASMVPIEARKYIPVPISEVQLDWFVVPEGETQFLSDEEKQEAAAQEKKAAQEDVISDKLLVLLVAIHNEVLQKYATVLKSAGLSPSFYEIEIFSSIRAVLNRGIAPVVIIDIGAARTKLYIVEFGIVRSSHVINKGSQDITLSLAKSAEIEIGKAEELKRELGLFAGNDEGNGQHVARAGKIVMEHIFAESERAIQAYQRRHNTNISQVILTGGGATLKGLQDLATDKFAMEVVMGNPFSKAATPAFLEEVLQQAGPEFAVALGLALRKLQEV